MKIPSPPYLAPHQQPPIHACLSWRASVANQCKEILCWISRVFVFVSVFVFVYLYFLRFTLPRKCVEAEMPASWQSPSSDFLPARKSQSFKWKSLWLIYWWSQKYDIVFSISIPLSSWTSVSLLFRAPTYLFSSDELSQSFSIHAYCLGRCPEKAKLDIH